MNSSIYLVEIGSVGNPNSYDGFAAFDPKVVLNKCRRDYWSVKFPDDFVNKIKAGFTCIEDLDAYKWVRVRRVNIYHD